MLQIDEFSKSLSIENPLDDPRAKEWDNMPMSQAKNFLFKHECNFFHTYFGF